MSASNVFDKVASAVVTPNFNTVITVAFYNWNCWDTVNNEPNMALTVDNANKLVLSEIGADGLTDQQKWILVPNLVPGSASGGFTLINKAAGLPVEEPVVGQQITLGDDPTPFGSKTYCWMLYSVSDDRNQHQWSIQTFDRGPVMDASNGGCADNTQVILHGWNGGSNYNQRWVIDLVS